MPLTNNQLHEVRAIIEAYHQAFIVSTVGPAAVSPEVLVKLKALGLAEVKVSGVEDAYLYGQLVASSEDPKVANLTYEEFKEYLRKNPIPLSDMELRAITFAKQRAAQYIQGLGNKVSIQTGELVIEADAALRNQLRGVVRDATAENIAKRESVKKLKSDLGWETKDWARDWNRISVTEKHTSMQRGVADNLAERHGPDVRVAKRPAPDACEHCKRLHLGPDGYPRIFKLSTLERNGLTNFGRKAADWLPVVGSTHPHCQCQLVRVPAGWGFDEDGSLAPGGEFGENYEDEADVQKAMLQEMDLQKAFALQGHIEFQGLEIAIENKVGSKRHWTDENGVEGTTEMRYAYGYIKGTEGADGDEIDVYLGPDPRATMVYVINQQDPKSGRYDEDKIFLGFSSESHARTAYQQHYDRPDFYITMTPMLMDHFKRWIHHTAPNEGELFKSGRPIEKLVIPLEKALVSTGNLAPELGAQSSRAGDRSPGPGTMMNYAAHIEPRASPTVSAEMREAHRTFAEASAQVAKQIRRDQSEMIFDSPMERRTYGYDLVIPADYHGERPPPDEIADQRESVENMDPHGWRVRGSLNTAEIGDTDDDDDDEVEDDKVEDDATEGTGQ